VIYTEGYKKNMNLLNDEELIGTEMYEWASELFPVCRSITGNGVRVTLDYIRNIIPNLQFHTIKSGTKVFDWNVPNEWNIFDAYVEDGAGHRWIDFKKNNLHVVGYSEPVDEWMSLEQLGSHLHTIPSQPTAIPYVTSYYNKIWGFCLSEDEKATIPNGKYHIVIDSELKSGVLNYADIVIPGRLDKEILISTYICHPSMANNELSGPVVTMKIIEWLQNQKLEYTYRIVFIPETIGSIVYIHKHHTHLKKHVVAGYVLTCIGDERDFSFMPSRQNDSLSDRVARAVFKENEPAYIEYSYLKRGSDERQYCSPSVDLPIASIMRSKYMEYPEYHTSLDDLSFISPQGLYGGYDIVKKCLQVIEKNKFYSAVYPCEPQLGKHGIMSTLSKWDSWEAVKNIKNVIAYADGNNDCITLADKTNVNISECIEICEMLLEKGIFQLQ
jgi:aminopeptidase-like protein